MNSHGLSRHLLLLTVVLMMGPAARAQTAEKTAYSGVKYFSHQSVEAGFAKGGYLYPAGEANFSIMTARRDRGGASELHVRDTDIFYIVGGEATFVTGGKLVEPRQIAPGEMRGSGVEGGTVWQLTEGDVIVIPAGTPHWFKQVLSPVRYFVVKVRQSKSQP